MPVYFYTPLVITERTIQDVVMQQRDPGHYVDGTLVTSSPPPGTVALKCDRTGDPTRFVLECYDGTTAMDGWEEKTPEEINDDYPGLIPEDN